MIKPCLFSFKGLNSGEMFELMFAVVAGGNRATYAVFVGCCRVGVEEVEWVDLDPASRIDYVRALHACTVLYGVCGLNHVWYFRHAPHRSDRPQAISVGDCWVLSLPLSLSLTVVSPPHPYPPRTPHNITPPDEFSSHGAVCMFQAQAPIEYCSLRLNSKRGFQFSRELFKSLRLVLV